MIRFYDSVFILYLLIISLSKDSFMFSVKVRLIFCRMRVRFLYTIIKNTHWQIQSNWKFFGNIPCISHVILYCVNPCFVSLPIQLIPLPSLNFFLVNKKKKMDWTNLSYLLLELTSHLFKAKMCFVTHPQAGIMV